MKKSPTLARKFENEKFKVVLKAKEWLAGVMMLREPPFLFASAIEREMQSTKTNELVSTADLLVSTANLQVNEHEQKRVERYHQWKSKGAPDEHILLQELILKKGDFTNAKRCLLETFSFQHEFSANASMDQVEHFLKQKMLFTKGLFSDVSFGTGFFPMISHMKTTTNEKEANSCIWYENSNAYVYPLKNLYQNNEIVVFQGTPSRDKETQFYLECASKASQKGSRIVCVESEVLNRLEMLIQSLKNEIQSNPHLFLDIIKLQLLFLSQKLLYFKQDKQKMHKCIQDTLGSHRIGIAEIFRCIQNDLFAQEWIHLWFSPNGFYPKWSHVTDILVEPLFSLASLAWDEKESR